MIPGSDFLRFTLLFSALYAAFGAASPFLPAFLSSRGLTPEQVGLALAVATTIRLLAAPIAGRIADRLHALRIVLAICAAAAGAFALCFIPTQRFLQMLTIGILHAAMLAPTSVLADALALSAAGPRRPCRSGFDYGWVRGAGSVAFIVGSLASGHAITTLGLASFLIAQTTCLAMAASAALSVPEPVVSRGRAPSTSGGETGVFDLVGMPAFRRLILMASLVLGSHAMHDSFAMIAWNAAGVGAGTGSLLWSESVAAEVVVFLAIGPFLLRRLQPETAMAIAAAAAVLRWAVMAQTADVAALAIVEPLHGLTFALLHLSCMRVLVAIVPRPLAATAQAIYATVATGATSALLTLLSGLLYARAGSGSWLRSRWLRCPLSGRFIGHAWKQRWRDSIAESRQTHRSPPARARPAPTIARAGPGRVNSTRGFRSGRAVHLPPAVNACAGCRRIMSAIGRQNRRTAHVPSRRN